MVDWFEDKFSREVSEPLVKERVIKFFDKDETISSQNLRLSIANAHIHMAMSIGWQVRKLAGRHPNKPCRFIGRRPFLCFGLFWRCGLATLSRSKTLVYEDEKPSQLSDRFLLMFWLAGTCPPLCSDRFFSLPRLSGDNTHISDNDAISASSCSGSEYRCGQLVYLE